MEGLNWYEIIGVREYKAKALEKFEINNLSKLVWSLLSRNCVICDPISGESFTKTMEENNLFESLLFYKGMTPLMGNMLVGYGWCTPKVLSIILLGNHTYSNTTERKIKE